MATVNTCRRYIVYSIYMFEIAVYFFLARLLIQIKINLNTKKFIESHLSIY